MTKQEWRETVVDMFVIFLTLGITVIFTIGGVWAIWMILGLL